MSLDRPFRMPCVFRTRLSYPYRHIYQLYHLKKEVLPLNHPKVFLSRSRYPSQRSPRRISTPFELTGAVGQFWTPAYGERARLPRFERSSPFGTHDDWLASVQRADLTAGPRTTFACARLPWPSSLALGHTRGVRLGGEREKKREGKGYGRSTNYHHDRLTMTLW